MTCGQKVFLMLLGSFISGLIGLFFFGEIGFLSSDGWALLGFFLPSVVLLVKINEKLNELLKNKQDK